MVFALALFIGLVVDTGYMVLTRSELQTVADASALAGAYTVKTNVAASRTYARNIGAMNYAAGIYIDLELNTTNDADGDFVVNDGIIYVNSDNTEAVCHSGQPTIDTAEIRVVGGTDRHYEQVYLTGEVVFIDERIPDPLAELPDPTWDPADDLGEIVPSATPYEPGFYSGGLDLPNNSITLNPGIYILDGKGLNVNGGDLYTNGSVFYIIDSTSKKPDSRIDLTGNGVLEMSPRIPTPTRIRLVGM